MTSRFPPRWCLGLVLAASALWIGSTPCLASASYSFTDLGHLSGAGNLTFDAQGQINPKTISPYYDFVRQQSGPYSISEHLAEAPPDNLYRALAITAGMAPVEIAPPAPYQGYYQTTFASAVNSSGTYVGTASQMIGNSGAAFMYTRDGGTKLVPTLYDGLGSALSINDAG
jgi:hypothetical protein